MEPEETIQEQVDEKDILDSSMFGTTAKLFSCKLCGQRFTNKLKITIHWAVNHGFKLCGLCSNYAFRYDSDKLQHERQHIPFGCSSCEHEFTTVCNETISEHYKQIHKSFLCFYCSSVIDPYSKYPEHIEKRHNFTNKSEVLTNRTDLYELIGDSDTGFFRCKLCNKKKRTNLLFGHYVFYHNLSVQALKHCIDKQSNIRINGSVLNEHENEPSRITEVGETSKELTCNVCENEIKSDSSVHDVFCQGYVMCNQKECEQLFENKKALVNHLDFEHPTSSCKFGCQETNLKAREVENHLQSSHDIVECSLCNIISGSGNLKNHLRDKHSVNLMTYEKAISQTSSKLYRVENLLRNKRQVLCNFCDHDITNEIREFSFLSHYQNEHEINITAILRNLDKNPIIDLVLNEKQLKTEEECLKHFTVVVESKTDELVEVDFDASKVCCIGPDVHIEQKTKLMSLNDDETPLIFCEFCKKTSFDASCRLYEHLHETHGFQLLNINDNCTTCQVNPEIKIQTDGDDKSFNLSLVCPLDESFHVTKDNFKNHMAFEHLDHTLQVDKIIYKCFVCNFAYNKLDDMRNHFKQIHPDIKMSYCSICRYKLTDPDENSDHFSLNHSDVEVKQIEKFCCKLCKKSFIAKNKAKLHFQSFHKKKEVIKKGSFKCQLTLCNEAFESKEDRKMHQMIAHPDEKLFACKTCPLKFSTKSGLSSHNLIHKNIVNTCEHCSKTFMRRDSYKEHLLIHSGVRQKCSFCDKTFVQRSNLVRHERIHLNDKPYKCSFCEKTFSDKGACTSHEKVHTKSEHSNCEVCGKHFARKQKLKYHMRIHTLENVLTCDCGKIFTESYSFRKHKETHLKKGRSDKCDDCGKIFKSAKAKNRHMATIHGEDFPDSESLIETKIQCTLCNLKDFTIESIKDHLSNVHQIEEAENWESYVRELEFDMDISDELIL